MLLVLAVLGAPAVVLRVLCAGKSCEQEVGVASTVPFCSLPDGLRTRVGSGFREDRSPDVLAVTNGIVVGGTGAARKARAPWPSQEGAGTSVPIVFSGAAMDAASLPSGAGLDDIAPTVADLLGFDRPHPEVRSGDALGDYSGSNAAPKLILVVVWKGVGTPDLRTHQSEWPNLGQLVASGPNTLDADTGSLPLDPAAILTTIGTGGLPSQHGITSRVVLNDEGRLVSVWSEDAPVSVIASLADDWDEERGQEPKIGLVATDATDQGVVGGNWYVDSDTDRIAIVSPKDVLRTALDELRRGYGNDGVADIVVVVDEGPIKRMDSNLARLTAAARKVTRDRFAMAVTATGSTAVEGNVVDASDVKGEVEEAILGDAEVVTAAAPGGLFLDQQTLAEEKIPDDAIIAALEDARSAEGGRLMDQVFPAIAVSFARYC